jgi:hypothetical protein
MNTNLKQQLESFNSHGIVLDNDGAVTKCYNFYDWFCKDSSLSNKAIALFKRLNVFLKHRPDINTETTYVFFKNNCPMCGSLYDDFRICDAKSGDVIYTVTPRSGHDSMNGQAEMWGRDNNFQGPLVVGSWKDVINYKPTK